jgi:nicotinate-nucleotide adenylyltransferase
MGGTFDPIHLGHLHVADTIRSQFNLDKVVFVPSHCPPHKSITDIAPVEHRYAMVKLAIADYTYFEASRIEIDRECPTYAGDTIEEFKKKYSADWRFYFITGLDALLTILNQYRSKTYPGICHFIAAARPGYNKEDIMKKIPADFVPDVSIVEEPDLAISSTAIRQKVKAGKAIDDMVPEVVRDYILKWDLYKWI